MSHRPITRKHFLTALGSLAATSLFLTGCATENSSSGSSASANSNGKVKVLASTDVYADIVKQVGGDNVEVSALISSTGTDPHSYEATSSDRLKAKDASLIVINGAGYDLFLEDLAGKDNASQKVVNAVKVSGKLTDAEYDTEPVPDYLISSTGAENATPSEFAEAVEAGNDVPALVLKETKDLISEKKVQLLAYNEQTATSQTNEVLQTAKDASVNYVSFTETLPENTDYLAWMKTNVSNLEKALS